MPPKTRAVPRLDELPATTTRGGAIDALAPAPAPEPADALAALLEPEADPMVTEDDRNDLAQLEHLQRTKREAEKVAKALVGPIRDLTATLLERRIDKGWHTWPGAVTKGTKEPLRPYTTATIYPKYRTNEDGERYGQADVTAALQATEDAKHLVTTGYDSKAFAAYVRKLIKAWREEVGETGMHDAEGRLVDAFGNVLTEVEAQNPTADLLGLPPVIRAVVESSEIENIGFSKG